MNGIKKTSKKGQAIVIFAFALVALLGFTALAVDGSMVYSDRRYAQDAADSSSLAGGAYAGQILENNNITNSNWNTTTDCSSGNIAAVAAASRVAAINRGIDNGFVLDQDASDGHGVLTQCGVDTLSFPKHGGGFYSVFNSHYLDFTTHLTSETKTSFAHLVFSGVLRNTVTAITRIYPRQGLAYGYAIIALNPNGCSGNKNGIQLRGNQSTRVEGGGIFSNGCMDVDGGNTTTIKNGSGAYFFPGDRLDHIHFVDNNNQPISGMTAVRLENNNAYRIPLTAYDIPVPDCTGHVVHESDIVGRDNLTGLYCIDGAFSFNGGTMKGDNVTLLFRGGKVTINGNASLQLYAPRNGYTGSAIPGVVIYMPKQYYGTTCGEVNQELKINGGSGSRIRGTILAPCSDISMEGGSGLDAFQSQIIGFNVNIGGNADLMVVYQDQDQASHPAKLDLYQ